MKKVEELKGDEEVVVICAGHSADCYDDNIRGQCSECGKPIVWRPYVPEPSTKLCMACGFASINEAEAEGHDVEYATSEKQVAEIEAVHGRGAVFAGWAMMDALRKWGRK